MLEAKGHILLGCSKLQLQTPTTHNTAIDQLNPMPCHQRVNCFYYASLLKKKSLLLKALGKNQFHLNGNPTHPHFTQIISQGGAAQQANCASSNPNGGYYSTISQPTHPLPWMHLQHPPHPHFQINPVSVSDLPKPFKSYL